RINGGPFAMGTGLGDYSAGARRPATGRTPDRRSDYWRSPPCWMMGVRGKKKLPGSAAWKVAIKLTPFEDRTPGCVTTPLPKYPLSNPRPPCLVASALTDVQRDPQKAPFASRTCGDLRREPR